jgi:hypothetical protein
MDAEAKGFPYGKAEEVSMRKQRDARWLGNRVQPLWMVVSLCLWFSGCHSPCQELSQRICQELSSMPRACTMVQEEARRFSASSRQCRALLATWRTYGRLRVARVQKEIRRYEGWLFERKKLQEALQELERAEKIFAGNLVALFRIQAIAEDGSIFERKKRRRARRPRALPPAPRVVAPHEKRPSSPTRTPEQMPPSAVSPSKTPSPRVVAP